MQLRVIDSKSAVHVAVSQARARGLRVGLVPTMGALHAGHLSLIHAARHVCDLVVATIFVNPTQFAPHEDLSRYPRPLERDLEWLAQAQVDIAFTPSVEEIYPPNYSTYVQPGSTAKDWEGIVRPDHFRGVTTIVLKLFQIAPAHIAFFGQKDYQQTQVIRQMVRDFNLDIEIRMEPTVREADGLALSSRNVYLSPTERQRAQAIPAAWRLAKKAYEQGTTTTEDLLALTTERLKSDVDSIDYVAFVDPTTLESVSIAAADTVMLLAVRIGTTRLIDNVKLGAAT